MLLVVDTSLFVSRVVVVPTPSLLRWPSLLSWREGLRPYSVVGLRIPPGIEKHVEPEVCLLYAMSARVFPETFASPEDVLAEMASIGKWYDEQNL